MSSTSSEVITYLPSFVQTAAHLFFTHACSGTGLFYTLLITRPAPPPSPPSQGEAPGHPRLSFTAANAVVTARTSWTCVWPVFCLWNERKKISKHLSFYLGFIVPLTVNQWISSMNCFFPVNSLLLLIRRHTHLSIISWHMCNNYLVNTCYVPSTSCVTPFNADHHPARWLCC